MTTPADRPQVLVVTMTGAQGLKALCDMVRDTDPDKFHSLSVEELSTFHCLTVFVQGTLPVLLGSLEAELTKHGVVIQPKAFVVGPEPNTP